MQTKVVIVGSRRTGKSRLVSILKGQKPEKKYIPTLGVNMHEIDGCHVRDTAGLGKHQGLVDGYYIGMNCAIVIFRTATEIVEANYYCKKLKRLHGKDFRITLIHNRKTKSPPADARPKNVKDRMVEHLMNKYNIVKYLELDIPNCKVKLADLL